MTVRIACLPPDFDRWDELLALISRSFAYMDETIDPPSSVRLLTPKNLEVKAGNETCLVALDETKPIGCVFAVERDEHFYVSKLAVDPGRQGAGIGRALLQAVEAHAVRAGKPILELQTRIELTGNHAAFEKLGFVETARTAHAGYDRPTSVTFRKAISAIS